jgi:hypothetical protein
MFMPIRSRVANELTEEFTIVRPPVYYDEVRGQFRLPKQENTQLGANTAPETLMAWRARDKYRPPR